MVMSYRSSYGNVLQVKLEYVTPIEEAVKYLIVKGWCLSKVRAGDITGIPVRAKTLCLRKKKRKGGVEEPAYEPEVLDLSKVSTPVELLATAEVMAEDAHDRWASNLKKTYSAFETQFSLTLIPPFLSTPLPPSTHSLTH